MEMSYRKKGIITRAILAVIPRDGWISAAEIAEKLNLNSYKVSSLICHRLMHKYVIKKAIMINHSRKNLYRRIE